MPQLEIEMLENIKDTLVALHGTKVTRAPEAYDKAIHDGCDPQGAWHVFSGTLRPVDVWQEMEDVDALLKARKLEKEPA